MRTYDKLEAGLEASSVVTIGNFDGVHLGHQSLFAAGAERARDLGVPLVVLTFSPHPIRHFRPDNEPFVLMTREQKLDAMAEHGVEAALIVDFGEVAGWEPRVFVERVLLEALGAKHVLVGEGFRFGRKRAGTTEVLAELGDELGFGTTFLGPVLHEGVVVSSTNIRAHVLACDFEAASHLLTRPYALMGTVERGDARGRTLGFPTANVGVENELLPPDGIYTTLLRSPRYGALPSCTYIGSRPTYGDGPHRVESFVLEGPDELDLYDQRLVLEVHEFLRGDAAYESDEALIAQMERDVARARAFFAQLDA